MSTVHSIATSILRAPRAAAVGVHSTPRMQLLISLAVCSGPFSAGSVEKQPSGEWAITPMECFLVDSVEL